MGRERTAEQYLIRPFQEAMGSKKLRVSVPLFIQSEKHVISPLQEMLTSNTKTNKDVFLRTGSRQI